MSARFEELAWRETAMGVISLRRRREPTLGVDVYEVKLDDEFLMSSLFTLAEVELARLALAEVEGTGCDVVVGGLGLGYTARAVLGDSRVRSLVSVEALDAVIEWHRDGVLPDAEPLTTDARSRLVHGDFFDMVASGQGLDPAERGRRWSAILLDVDHSPRHVLHESHAWFYEPPGLRRVAGFLRPGGVFGLWSDDSPDDEVVAALGEAFDQVRSHVVTFPTHYGAAGSNTVYVAKVNPARG